MIQDIFPHRLDISFALPEQQTDDFILCFRGRKIALREDGSYPRRWNFRRWRRVSTFFLSMERTIFLAAANRKNFRGN